MILRNARNNPEKFAKCFRIDYISKDDWDCIIVHHSYNLYTTEVPINLKLFSREYLIIYFKCIWLFLDKYFFAKKINYDPIYFMDDDCKKIVHKFEHLTDKEKQQLKFKKKFRRKHKSKNKNKNVFSSYNR